MQLTLDRRVLADAGNHDLEVLSEVSVRLPEGECSGVIVVAPDDWLRPPSSVTGVIVWVRQPMRRTPDIHLPGADLPGLGTRAETEEHQGLVVGIDPVHRTVTIEVLDGETVTVPTDDLIGTSQ